MFAHVADTTCRRKAHVLCLPDMSYDMSDMLSKVAATCRNVTPVESAPKTRHVATSRNCGSVVVNAVLCAREQIMTH